MNPRTQREAEVCIIAPSPAALGGMAVQGEKLVAHLRAAGVGVAKIETGAPVPKWLRPVEWVPVLRIVIWTLIFLGRILRRVPRAAVAHQLTTACGIFFLCYSVPLLVLCRVCRTRLVLNCRSGKLSGYLRRWAWLAIPFIKLADCVAVPSAYLQKLLAAYGVRARLLPNIADLELFPYVSRAGFAPKLIVARQLEPVYGVEAVIRAFQIVQAQVPGAELGICGSGSEQGRLKHLVAAEALTSVTFHDRVNHADLPRLYARYDIAVNASLADNFPNALLEAALSGLAVVTTPTGGIPDMFTNDTAMLVESPTAEALAAGILNAIRYPSDASARAERARRWAEQFSWDSVMPVLLDCYQLRSDVAEALPRRSGAPCITPERHP